MSVDRTKVLEAAQKYLGKGNYDKAIGELRKLVKEDPKDIRTWLKIGDLYTRKGSRNEAIETYARVANEYGEQGFFLKAVAVFKQILKLDPARLDIQIRLAEMYEMLHLVSDALSTYEHVAAAYARADDIDKALDTLRKMTALDPENIPVRIKAAEALSKAGRAKEAAEEFEAGAALLKAQGRIDDYIKVAERLLYHREDAVDQARELAQLYLERDDPKRALSKLQLCFKADPKDIPTLELLAEAFNQLGQLPKTISVYKEVARIHHEANRAEDRARIVRRILELDPGDREARQALAGYAQGGSVRRDIQPPASAIMQPSARAPTPSGEADQPELIHEDDDDLEVIEMDDEEIIIVDDDDIEMDVPVAAAKPSVPPDVQREAQIARLLTECDVFLRYGLKQKVVEQLTAVLDIDPAHVEARERLKDIFLESGRIDEAVGELLTLADVLSGDQSAAAMLYLRQILELDPGHAEARSRLGELGVSAPDDGAEVGATAEELAPSTEPPDDDGIFFVDDAVEERTDNTEIGGAETFEMIEDQPVQTVPGDPGAPTTATDAVPYVEPPAPRNAIPPPPSGQLDVPAPSGSQPVPAPRTGAPLLDPLAPMSPQEFDDVPLRASAPGEMEKAVSQRLSMPPGEVEELLDEADFFIAQGLMDEARASLQDALESHPGHILIQDKLREVDETATHAAASRASQEVELDQSFELAEKLAEGFDEVDDTQAGSDVLDVEQVFAQFKKGVEEQVGVEDTETHFDLGIAYKEMGLIDDAIGEFRLCLANSSRVCIAETMIGLCHIEKNEIAEAISHFKKGLYADHKTDREELGLYFELGRAYELLHDPKEALYYYQKVQKRDGSFRKVDALIDALSNPQAPVVNTPPDFGQDDIDRAFDDLMGED